MKNIKLVKRYKIYKRFKGTYNKADCEKKDKLPNVFHTIMV
jgi:hypothetical protein